MSDGVDPAACAARAGDRPTNRKRGEERVALGRRRPRHYAGGARAAARVERARAADERDGHVGSVVVKGRLGDGRQLRRHGLQVGELCP